MLTRSSSAACRQSPVFDEDFDQHRRSTITNDDDQQINENCTTSTSFQAKPLKKRWLANHQEQQLTHSNIDG